MCCTVQMDILFKIGLKTYLFNMSQYDLEKLYFKDICIFNLLNTIYYCQARSIVSTVHSVYNIVSII